MGAGDEFGNIYIIILLNNVLKKYLNNILQGKML